MTELERLANEHRDAYVKYRGTRNGSRIELADLWNRVDDTQSALLIEARRTDRNAAAHRATDDAE